MKRPFYPGSLPSVRLRRDPLRSRSSGTWRRTDVSSGRHPCRYLPADIPDGAETRGRSYRRAHIDPDIHPNIKIIKALSVSSEESLQACKQYEGHVDMFLFDTCCDSYGGSGEQFDWKVLASYDGDTPFLLSGGIGPEDASRIKAFSHAQFAGIDLNSKFETAPALKDVEKLKTFIQEIRQDA